MNERCCRAESGRLINLGTRTTLLYVRISPPGVVFPPPIHFRPGTIDSLMCCIAVFAPFDGATMMAVLGMQAHRTLSRVRSVSSPRLLLVFLAISMGLAAPIIPLAETTVVSGAGFLVINSSDEVWRKHFYCVCAAPPWRGMAYHLSLLALALYNGMS